MSVSRGLAKGQGREEGWQGRGGGLCRQVSREVGHQDSRHTVVTKTSCQLPAVAKQVQLIISMSVCNTFSFFNAHALITSLQRYFIRSTILERE